MKKDFEICRQGTEVRIRGRGKNREEALAALVKGFASYQLPEGEAVVLGNKKRELKFGYSKEKYLPADLLNDVIGLEAANQELYPEVSEISLKDGIFTAQFFVAKKKPRLDPRSAVYIGSRFIPEGDGWLAEAEVIA